MDILLKELDPGQKYIFQARSRSASGKTSAWSTAFEHTTLSDVTAPNPVEDLTWDTVGTSFVATWTKPILDSNGKPLKDFKDYKVTLTGDSVEVIYFVQQERFDFPIEANRNAFAVPQPSIQISVQVRDMAGNLSTAEMDTATNPAPGNVTGLVADGITNGISLTWDLLAEDDIKAYEVYVSTSGAGFTPSGANLTYVSNSNTYSLFTTNEVEHFFKVRAVDVFNQGSASYASASATPEASTGVDISPPDDPTDVAVSTNPEADGSSSIEVTWTGVSSPNLSDYLVRYSTDELGWRYVSVPSNQENVTIFNLLPATNYYVQVAAMSYANVKSDFVNAGTYPINTAADTTAPSQPAAPTVSTSTLAAQVSHDMTKQGGGNLEADVVYLEVHASTSTGFTPSNSTLRGTIDVAGQGIAVSGVFYYGVTDSVTNLYWKVKAVDRAKNKSAASNQATGVPDLILNANIGNATITSAKINDLVANKITAGTGIINALDIKNTLTIATGGHVRSSDWNGTDTGWSLDQTGLVIYGGTIAAAALQLQDSNNIIPGAFADFQFNNEYYSTAGAVNTVVASTVGTGVSVTIDETNSKFGSKSLRLSNGAITNPTVHDLIFAPSGLSTTDLNIDVSPGTYIFSGYFKKNGSVNALVKFGVYTDAAASVISSAATVNSTSWTRFEAQLVVPSGVSKLKAYLEFGPAVSNTGYDFLVDGLQLERKLTGATTAGVWKPPSQTTIDGGQIITGSIRSSASSSTVAGQPAWSINTAGNMQIGDAQIRGSLVVGSATTTINLMPDRFAGFENVPSFYTSTSNLTGPPSNTTVVVETSGGQSGQYMHFTNTTLVGNDDLSAVRSQYLAPASATSQATNNVFITSGQKYIISLYLKNLQPSKSCVVRIGVWQNTSNHLPANTDPVLSTSSIDISAFTSWTRVTLYYTGRPNLSSGKVTLNFYPKTGSTGFEVGVDGIMVETRLDEATTTASAFTGGYTEDSYVQSQNFLSGVSGWRIDSKGNAEFNETVIRGKFSTTSDLGSIEMNLLNSRPTLTFWNDDLSNYAFINVVDDTPGEAALGINTGIFATTAWGGSINIYSRLFMVGPGFSSTLGYVRQDNQNPIGGEIIFGINQISMSSYNSSNTVLARVNVSGMPGGDGLISMQGGDGSALNGPNVLLGGTSQSGYLRLNGEVWTNLSFATGWSTYTDGGVAQTVQYKLFPDGMVRMRGAAVNGGSGAALIGTLPAGYRPPAAGRVRIIAANANITEEVYLDITSTGTISISQVDTDALAHVNFSCVQFSVV